MKRNFFYAGLLASALLVTSCVDDTESGAVKNLRTAQVEKLKAETALDLANVELQKSTTALNVEQLAFNKANNELKLAMTKANNDVVIEQAKARLEQAKHDLEVKKQQVVQDLEEYKLTLKKAQDKLAQDIRNYDGKVSAEKLADITKKHREYTQALVDLAGKEALLPAAEQAVVAAKNNSVDVQKEKEKSIAENEVKIKALKDLIAKLKTYEQYKEDQAKLDLAKAEAENETAKAKNTRDLAMGVMNDANMATGNVGTKIMNSGNLDFYKGLEALKMLDPNIVKGSTSIWASQEFNGETYVEGTYSQDYTIYNQAKLASVNTNRFNLYVDGLKAAERAANTNVSNNNTALRTAQTDFNTKKTAYDADKTDAAKKADYEAALATLEGAQANLEAAQDALKDVKKKIADANKYNGQVVNGREEVVNLFKEYNAAALDEAKKIVAYNKLNDAYLAKKKISDAAASVAADSKSIADQIETAEKAIKTLERDNVNLQNVNTQEALIAQRQAELEQLKGQIADLKIEVANTKKAYEAALATLS